MIRTRWRTRAEETCAIPRVSRQLRLLRRLPGGVAFFIYSVSIKVSVFARGKGDNRFDHLFERLTSLVPYLLGNARVARKRYWYSGLLHTLIWWGFLVLQVRTLNFLLKGFSEDISLEHLGGVVLRRHCVRAPMDMFNILVLVGCAMAAWQRRFWKPARMTFNMDAWLILFFIAFLMVTRHLRQQLRDLHRPAGAARSGRSWRTASSQVWNGIGMSQGVAEGFLDLLVVRAPLRLPGLPQLPAVQQALARAHGDVQHRSSAASRRPGKLQPIKDFENRGALRRRRRSRTSPGSRCSTRTPAPSAGAARSTARRSSPARSSRRRRSCTTCAPPSSTRCARSVAAVRLGRAAPGRTSRTRTARNGDGNGHAQVPRRPDADRCRRLQPDLGLRDVRRLPVPVPGVHRARPGAAGHAPLPDDERSQHAGDGVGDADADRAARPPVARHAVHAHVVDGGARHPDVRRHRRSTSTGSAAPARSSTATSRSRAPSRGC